MRSGYKLCFFSSLLWIKKLVRLDYSKNRVQFLEKIQKNVLDGSVKKMNISHSENVLRLLNQGVNPVGYNLVISVLLLLNKIFVGETILIQLEFWKSISSDCNTRSINKVLIFARKIREKRWKLNFVCV